MRDQTGLPLPSGTSVTIRLAGLRSLSAAVAILACAAVGGVAAQGPAAIHASVEGADTAFDRVWPDHPRPVWSCSEADKITRESVFLRASIADSDRSTLTTQTDFMAQQVAEAMRSMMGGSAASLAEGDGTVHPGSVPAELDLVARPDGTVQRVATSRTGDTTATTLLVKAFDATRANGDALLVWPDGYNADSIFVRLILNSLPVKHENSVIVQYNARPAYGIFHISEHSEAPALAMPNNREPSYPMSDRQRRVEGTLMLEFVVDTNGNPIRRTIHDLWPRDKPPLTGDLLHHYEDFVDASKRAAASWRFYPARLGKCHVPQIVQIPIRFMFASH